MVSPLDGLHRLAHIAAMVRRAVQRQGAAGRAAASTRQAGESEAAAAERLTVTLQRRVRELRGDPAHRQRLVARMLIESVLLEEFGHDLTNEAEFQNVVDDVLKAIESLPGIGTELDRIAAQLAGPGSS